MWCLSLRMYISSYLPSIISYCMYLISDWSLTNWFTENDYTNGTDLSPDAIAQLMEALGLTEYMLDTPCDRSDSTSVYSLAYLGWSSGIA